MPFYSYRFMCHCGYKKITDDPESLGLIEVNRSAIQTKLPKLGTNNKTVPGSEEKQKRIFKCPDCGRAIAPSKIPDAQKNLQEKLEQDRMKEQRKKDEKDIFDGREKRSQRRSV